MLYAVSGSLERLEVVLAEEYTSNVKLGKHSEAVFQSE